MPVAALVIDPPPSTFKESCESGGSAGLDQAARLGSNTYSRNGASNVVGFRRTGRTGNIGFAKMATERDVGCMQAATKQDSFEQRGYGLRLRGMR